MKTFFHFLGMLLHVKHERHREKIYEIVLIEVNVLKKVETLKKTCGPWHGSYQNNMIYGLSSKTDISRNCRVEYKPKNKTAPEINGGRPKRKTFTLCVKTMENREKKTNIFTKW